MKNKIIMSQGGSVAGFLVVGLILVALAGGAIYFVQQRGVGEVEKPVDIVKTPSSTEKKANDKENKPASTPASSSENGVKNKGTTLPETGPADGLAGIAISALVVGFFVAYIQSLRYRLAWAQR